MKLHIAMLAATLLLSGGASYAQGNKQEKKAKAYMVADAHLDTQWNWDVQTTIDEYLKHTLVRNFYLFQHYPNYVFNFEGGVKYAWMKEYYPAQYEEMKKYIGEGRWHISGSSWDATDALVPSTESFIRNIMLGQQYYRHLPARLFRIWLDTAYYRFALRPDWFLFTKAGLACASVLW